MGVIKCDKHGYIGFYEICVHLHEVYKQKMYQKANEIPLVFTWVCDECAKNVRLEELNDMKGMQIDDLTHLPEEEMLVFSDRASEKYDQIDRHIACVHCYLETKLKHDRALGIRDPFFVYEKTLLYQDATTIDKLRAYLVANYTFAPFQVYDHFQQYYAEALIIQSGNLSHPLNIDIYYVTDKTEQEQILTLINRFFADIPQKQRKIRFIEKEVSTVDNTAKEKVLLEIEIS